MVKWGAWISATRPKTLVASFIPVMVGASLAFSEQQEINLFLLFLCFSFSFLVQIGTNLSNDYFDFIRGSDRNRILAPTRAVASGLLKPNHVRNAAYFLLGISFAVGIVIYKISDGPNSLIWIGLASVICAVVYTGGPFPLAYNGLGDLFVILFYGFIAVEATHFVLLVEQKALYTPDFIAALSIGCMTNILLVVNNFRDYEEDMKNKKNTLIVIFGRKFGFLLFISCYLIALLICPFLEPRLWLLYFCLPLSMFGAFKILKAKTKRDFDKLISLSAISLLFSGLLSVAGILLYY
ncbi:MAG TPA: 1,4-dihydroxy-2-naphthoate octaprenyltransferase [Opitutae bacterium]|nr:1,4-dihydroxy-2-naphthoate octaprenyltransferase [Opitutae bacterium]